MEAKAVNPDLKKENHFLRMFCALLIVCVVYVHYSPTNTIFGYRAGDFVQMVGRFAMPVFFMISGYYLYSKDGHSENDILRKIKRLSFLFVVLVVFYILLNFVLVAFDVITFANMCQFLFDQCLLHAWFVVFLIITYIIHYVLHRYKIDFKYLLPFGAAFIVLDLLFADILPLCGVDYIFGYRTCTIGTSLYAFIAFFFFQAGYYTHKYKDKIDARFSNALLIIICIVSLALSIVEGCICMNNGTYAGSMDPSPNLTIGATIFAFALFVGSFRLGEKHLRCRPLEWMGRNIMGWMYVFISAGSYPLKLIYFDSVRGNNLLFNAVGPILSVIVDIVLALAVFFLLTKLSERKKKKANAGMPA